MQYFVYKDNLNLCIPNQLKLIYDYANCWTKTPFLFGLDENFGFSPPV